MKYFHNQFATYDIAKELNSIMFNIPSIAYFYISDDKVGLSFSFHEIFLDDKVFNTYLWQQVQEWMLEEHKLDVHIYPVNDLWTYEIVDLNEDIVHVSLEIKDKQECLERAYLSAIKMIINKELIKQL